MIYSVRGVLAGKGENYAVLDVAGIELKLFLHSRLLESLPPIGSPCKFFSSLYVREDGPVLYGLGDPEELRFFELLNSVAGVGPKSALAILGVATINQIAAAIHEGRPDLLTRASGVGQKTAERIALELKHKVKGKESGGALQTMESDADVLEALVGLGYRRDEARAALGKVERTLTDPSRRLKTALGILGGKGDEKSGGKGR
ncbi:Holliday junction branch migration protein RuvA [Candidatus Parcubacteria bacterium]|nr:MAG: Holliday junction branch migration protein RuvA [Candidatus Parcubacteria bacterium]